MTMQDRSAPWRRYSAEELDRQYDARGSVASFETEYARYVAASETVRREIPRIADLCFDEKSGETLDFYSAGRKSPVFLWIHGGYWRALSKEDNAFVVSGLVPHGISVAVMNYTLAPAVGIGEIVRQVRRAASWLHRYGDTLGVDSRRVHVGGSSAGGHLTGTLLSGGWHDDFDFPKDGIGTALALSGLFDLHPLRHTRVDGWMRFDSSSLAANSPLLTIPRRGRSHLLAAVGGLETDEFRRQTRDYLARWRTAGNRGEEIAMPDHNHFDIALSLGEPEGVLARAVVASIRRSA
jgi:arylformamidase